MANYDYTIYDNLVTANYVVSQVFTNGNTDSYLIRPGLVQMAEFAHLKSALGDDFYLHLKQTYNAGGTGTTAEDSFMENWLRPTFAWFVRFEVINEIQMNSTSSGVVSAIPEFSKVVSPKELNVYKQDTYRRGKVMLQEVVKFLDENPDDFPKYNTSNATCSNNKNAVSKQHGMIIY